MGKSLAGAKINFENTLRDIFKRELEEALKSAYMTQFSENNNQNASKINLETKKVMEIAANNFAVEAADKFSSKASKDIANAIYNYIKEMQITITHTSLGTLISPMGPVTGTFTILPSEVTIS